MRVHTRERWTIRVDGRREEIREGRRERGGWCQTWVFSRTFGGVSDEDSNAYSQGCVRD